MVSQPRYMHFGEDADATIVATLAHGDPLGHTTDELADALSIPTAGDALQMHLEELVHAGVLDRRGIGRGAIYALAAPTARHGVHTHAHETHETVAS